MTTRPYTFARHGARRFIALGPLPNAASCADENVNISGLADVAFVMGNALLSHLPVLPKGRSIIGRFAEGVRKSLRRQKILIEVVSLQDSVKVEALYVLILGHPCYTELSC